MFFWGKDLEDKQRQYVWKSKGPYGVGKVKSKGKHVGPNGAGQGAREAQRTRAQAAGGLLDQMVDSLDLGFVLSVVGLNKMQYFQNSLGRERRLTGWAELEAVVSLGMRSACHMLFLESHLYVPNLNSLALQCPLEEPHTSQEGAVLLCFCVKALPTTPTLSDLATFRQTGAKVLAMGSLGLVFVVL